MTNDLPRTTTRLVDWVERLAVGASFACLVHCLALPVLIAALPLLARVLKIPESFHLWVLAFAVPASSIALFSRRGRHGVRWPMLLGYTGLTLLALGAIAFGGTPYETPVTVLGSVSLAAAHIANWQLRHGHPTR